MELDHSRLMFTSLFHCFSCITILFTNNNNITAFNQMKQCEWYVPYNHNCLLYFVIKNISWPKNLYSIILSLPKFASKFWEFHFIPVFVCIPKPLFRNKRFMLEEMTGYFLKHKPLFLKVILGYIQKQELMKFSKLGSNFW